MKKYLAAFILLFLCSVAFGAAPTRTHTYVSGTTIRANDVTTNEDNLYGYLQTGVDTLRADAVDAITEIKSTLKSGADGTVITGTKGTTGHCAQWNADGDLVTHGAACNSQSLWSIINANGEYTTADATTDTLTVTGETGVVTRITGDSLVIGLSPQTMGSVAPTDGYVLSYEETGGIFEWKADATSGANLWTTFNAYGRGQTTASTTTDILYLAVESGATARIVGDTLTLGTTAGGSQSLWSIINAYGGGSTTANSTSDILYVTGETGLTTRIVGDVLTIGQTNLGTDQNLWYNINAYGRGKTTANTTTDTLFIAVESGATARIVGDILTLGTTAAGSQNIWATFEGDAGSTVADSTSDKLTVIGGTGIDVGIVGDTMTIYGSSAGSQSLWATVNAYGGGSTTANSTTDILYVDAETGITARISGDVLIIGQTNLGADQNIWSVVEADAGSTTANSATDKLTVIGGTGVNVTISGDIMTIDGSTGGSQNIWATVNAYGGGSTAANSTTDILYIDGETGITARISGDVLTLGTANLGDIVGDSITTKYFEAVTTGVTVINNGFDISGNFTVSSTTVTLNIPLQINTTGNPGIAFGGETADPCATESEGFLNYNETDHYFCYCTDTGVNVRMVVGSDNAHIPCF